MTEQEHMTLNVGETLSKHASEDGPVVSRVSEIQPGQDTLTIEADVSALSKAIQTDLRDSYTSVHLWCDGTRLAITDHKEPMDEVDARTLDECSETVVRAEVIQPTDGAQRTMANRDELLTALDEFDESDTVTVMLEHEWPVIFAQGDSGVGVAPIARPPIGQKKGGVPQ